MVRLLEEHPCLYLKEIKICVDRIYELSIDISYIGKQLQDLGLNRKKVILISFYRKTPRVQRLRLRFRIAILHCDPRTLYFIDEIHFSNEDLQVCIIKTYIY